MTDKRIITSKNAIQQAYWELRSRQSFNKITVSQIVTRAGINRSTFYAHYLDKYDLRDQLEDQLLDQLAQLSANAPATDAVAHQLTADELVAYLDTILQFVHDHHRSFQMLLDDSDSHFEKKLEQFVAQNWQAHGLDNHFSVPLDYALAALANMASGLLLVWIKNGCQETVSEFSEILKRILLPLLDGILVQ